MKQTRFCRGDVLMDAEAEIPGAQRSNVAQETMEE